jgi:hypothetical protein
VNLAHLRLVVDRLVLVQLAIRVVHEGLVSLVLGVEGGARRGRLAILLDERLLLD